MDLDASRQVKAQRSGRGDPSRQLDAGHAMSTST
jgi:hypothetical protein